MSVYVDGRDVGNRILNSLPHSVLRILQPDLRWTELPAGKILESCDRPIGHVHFIESGVASYTAEGRNGGRVETDVLGYEGMSGKSLLLGVDRPEFPLTMTIEGSSLAMPAGRLEAAIDNCETLRRNLNGYCYASGIQVTQNAAAAASRRIRHRLARWILMYADRVRGDLDVTHDDIAERLAVRRASVTTEIATLEGMRLIRAQRKMIIITDREGLIAETCGSYGIAEAVFERLLPASEDTRQPANQQAQGIDIQNFVSG